MKVRLYTDNEIKILEQNIFVRKVKYKREIEYDPLFKLWAIMMRFKFPELSAREIFSRAGFDVNILHPNEYYQSITCVKDKKIVYDTMKMQLMDFVLSKLKELNINDNR